MGLNSENRLEKLASKAADKAVKALQSSGEALEFADSFSFAGEAVEAGIEDGEAAAAFDIFDHCEEITKKGHQIQYVVKRNGEMLGIKYHPYSWEQLQKEFRGGQYQVVAKSLTTKRYLKSETRTLSDPIRGLSGIEDETETVKVAPAPTPQGPNFMELFTLFQTMNEKQRVEAREAAREQANSAQANMMAFVEMMKSTQTGSQQMFFEIAKMTQQVSEKLAESQKQMFEKMENRFERVIDKIQTQTQTASNKPEFGLFELMKLQQDSQEKGFQLFNKLSQIAEAKAAEKIELIEELKSERGDEPAEKKSMTDSLIETMLPTITAALAAPQGVPAQAQAVPQQRRVLPPGATAHQARAAQARPTAARNPTQTGGQAQAARGAQAGAGSGNAGGQAGVTRNSVGLPKIVFPTATAKAEAPTQPVGQGYTKDQYQELLVPIFGECLLNSVSPEEGAAKISTAIAQTGNKVSQFLHTVSFADIMGIVRSYELPEEANPWFETVYAHLSSQPGNAVGGKHA